MLKIRITFKNGRKLELKHIDNCYLDNNDNMWRFFNDLDDRELIGDTCGVEIDGDTIFIPNDAISLISFR